MIDIYDGSITIKFSEKKLQSEKTNKQIIQHTCGSGNHNIDELNLEHLTDTMETSEFQRENMVKELNNFIEIMKTPVKINDRFLEPSMYQTAGLEKDHYKTKNIEEIIEGYEKLLSSFNESLDKQKNIKDEMDKIINETIVELNKMNMYAGSPCYENSYVHNIRETAFNICLSEEEKAEYKKISEEIDCLLVIIDSLNQDIIKFHCSSILQREDFKNYECSENDFRDIPLLYDQITEEILCVMTEEEKKLLLYIKNIDNLPNTKNGEPLDEKILNSLMTLWKQRAAEKRCKKRLDNLFNDKNEIFEFLLNSDKNNQNLKYLYLKKFGCLTLSPEEYESRYNKIVQYIYDYEYGPLPPNAKANEKYIEEIKNNIPTIEEFKQDYYFAEQELYNQKLMKMFENYKDEEITSENYEQKIDELIKIFDISVDDIVGLIEKNVQNLSFLMYYSITPQEYKENYDEITDVLKSKGIDQLPPSVEEYKNAYYQAAIEALYNARMYEYEDFYNTMKVFGIGVKDGIITFGEDFIDILLNNGSDGISDYERLYYLTYLSKNFKNLDIVYNIGTAVGYELPPTLISLLTSYGLSSCTSIPSHVFDCFFDALDELSDYESVINEILENIIELSNQEYESGDIITYALVSAVLNNTISSGMKKIPQLDVNKKIEPIASYIKNNFESSFQETTDIVIRPFVLEQTETLELDQFAEPLGYVDFLTLYNEVLERTKSKGISTQLNLFKNLGSASILIANKEYKLSLEDIEKIIEIIEAETDTDNENVIEHVKQYMEQRNEAEKLI